VRFGTNGLASGEAVPGPADLPPIDVAGLMNAIKDVATINPLLIGVNRPDSDADRNLFQYGERRPPPPPPPTPAELEAQRRAAEAALAAQEAQLRAQKEQERLAEEARMLAEQQARENPPPDQPPQPPPPPPKPAPPAINFRLMGMMGPPDRKLGVFLDGDKVMMARQGDVLLGQFKVLSIGVEAAEIGYVDPVHKDFKKRLPLGQ
jgi:hypothetical protein